MTDRRGAAGTPGSERPQTQGTGKQGADLQDMARDWITIWHSELNAMGGDIEAREAWSRCVGMWAGMAQAAAAFIPTPPARDERANSTHGAHRTGAVEPARAAAAAAASGGRDDAFERLARRVEELERRLAQFEQPDEQPPKHSADTNT